MDKSKTRKSIIKTIQLLAADCNQEIKDIENLVEAWHISLRDISDDEIWQGLKKALDRKNKFLIGSGEFKELCLTGLCHSGIESEAREAWNLVRKNLNYYAYPVFKNAVISEVIRNMGGWKKICSMLVSEEPFREKDFINHYNTYKNKSADYQKNVIRFQSWQKLKFIGFNEIDNMQDVIDCIKKSAQIENEFFKMLA